MGRSGLRLPRVQGAGPALRDQRIRRLLLHELPQGKPRFLFQKRAVLRRVTSQWGLVNFDCSTLWVRDRTYLTDALDVTPEFLRTKHGDEGTVIDYRNWHLALGRRFRALKVWFVLRSYGIQGFQAHISRVRLHSLPKDRSG
jgi:hypothetical protein